MIGVYGSKSANVTFQLRFHLNKMQQISQGIGEHVVIGAPVGSNLSSTPAKRSVYVLQVPRDQDTLKFTFQSAYNLFAHVTFYLLNCESTILSSCTVPNPRNNLYDAKFTPTTI